MIVYSGNKDKFLNDVMSNDIGGIIEDYFFKVTGKRVGHSEKDSWTNSLQAMERVVRDDEIPKNIGISVEYHIPRSTKRIDFIISGLDQNRKESVVLIELKQWQKAELTTKDAIVSTRYKHGIKETAHPSYQAWSYKKLLEDYNQTVNDEKISLYPCAYLHNYTLDSVIQNDFYKEYTLEAPVFLKTDAKKLQDFIKKYMKYGDSKNVMYRIDNGKIRPSKNLADELLSMLSGNDEFVMIDDQKVVYENALDLSKSSDKNVLIVEGGPGTGKSVLAINLLVELTKQEKVVQYVTRNSAPREVYEAKLTGAFKKSHISNLFSGSGSFHSLERDSFDCIIVDEAHRLNEKSGMFSHLGVNQVMEIIQSSKLSIFFVDEDQKVTLKDIGDKDEIKRWAKLIGASITELNLESQFRCNGSDGYISWLDNTLQIKETANIALEGVDFDFKVMTSPEDLHQLIIQKNAVKNKARLVAGYCWKWISKKDPSFKDIVIDNFEAKWNLDEHGQKWIIQPDSVSEVGCIHTCQGLEVDYIGVIIGPDLVVRNGTVITRPYERASSDKSVHGMKKLLLENPEDGEKKLDAIIKNTYRTLMTRGQKGCYIYCTDKETGEYFSEVSNFKKVENGVWDGLEMEELEWGF